TGESGLIDGNGDQSAILDLGAYEYMDTAAKAVSIEPQELQVQCFSGGDIVQTQFSITNNNTDALEWSIVSDNPGMTPVSAQGSVTNGAESITVEVDPSQLDTGSNTCTLEVSTSGVVTGYFYVNIEAIVELPQIVVEPNNIEFSSFTGQTEILQESILISNGNPGGTMHWQINESCDWLTVDPASGTIVSDSNTVTLSAYPTGLTKGEYSCTVEIVSSAASTSPVTVPVTLAIDSLEISVDPSALDFMCVRDEENPTAKSFTVSRVQDKGVLDWQITYDCNWVDVSPVAGQSSGEEDEITVSVDNTGLETGSYQCVLTVSAPDANDKQVTVNCEVEGPGMAVSTQSLSFQTLEGVSIDECQSFWIRNTGAKEMEWHITGGTDWLDFDPNSGRSSGEKDFVELSVDVNGLIPAEYTCDLTVDSNSRALNSPLTVTVNLTVNPQIHVPADYATIQEAIDAAVDGDGIIVADDEYTVPSGINFLGKAIWLHSANGPENCILKRPGGGTVVTFNHAEDRDSILEGVTITDSNEAIRCYRAGPVIRDCVIKDNVRERAETDYGEGVISVIGYRWSDAEVTEIIDCRIANNGDSGITNSAPAIAVDDAKLTLRNCLIEGNYTGYNGGGVESEEETCSLEGCWIVGNSAAGKGGGLYLGGDEYAQHDLRECRIVGNEAQDGGGVYVNCVVRMHGCSIVVNNATGLGGGIYDNAGKLECDHSIFWGNSDLSGSPVSAQIFCDESGTEIVNCCIDDGQPGDANVPFGAENGNIDQNPLFVRIPSNGGDGWGDDPATPGIDESANDDYGDLHLTINSPCIEAGSSPGLADHGTDMDGQSRPLGRYMDIGVDEYTPVVVVSSPSAGEFWTSGSVHQIEWTSAGVGNLGILLSRDGGASWQTIDTVSAGVGSYTWQIPDLLNSDQCIISVAASPENSGLLVYDSGLFSVRPDRVGPVEKAQWSSLGGGMTRNALAEVSGPLTGCVKWSFDANSPISGSTVVSKGGAVYLTTEEGSVYKLDSSGNLLWSLDLGDNIEGSPTLGSDGSLYVGTEAGELWAISSDGNVRWTHRNGWNTYAAPAVSNDGTRIYTGSMEGGLRCLGVQGSELWEFDPNGSVTGSPAVDANGTVYVSDFYEADLYALDANTGDVKWKCDFDYAGRRWTFASPVLSDGVIYQAMAYDPNLYAVDADSGEVIWSVNLSGKTDSVWDEYRDPSEAGDPLCRQKPHLDKSAWSEPVVAPDGTIYLSMGDPYLRAVNPNGTLKWVAKLGNSGSFSLTVEHGGLIYAANSAGRVYVLKGNVEVVKPPDEWNYFRYVKRIGGKIVSWFRGDGSLNHCVIANDGTLLVSDSAGKVWAISYDKCSEGSRRLALFVDINNDGRVSYADIEILASEWLCEQCEYEPPSLFCPPDRPYRLAADINQDRVVDFADYVEIAEQWMRE
ncbi:MAG: PQQ-binding-like beta-propeller repeat protein, partial [Planctomycetes bacterium]|nr:PQQ-binding-like beta-propeller repeat protein [Planctomycetota bacterium]